MWKVKQWNYLELKSMFFSTVFLYLRINIFHKSISFHQHVSKGRTSKYTHNLRAYWRQIFQRPGKYSVYRPFIHVCSFSQTTILCLSPNVLSIYNTFEIKIGHSYSVMSNPEYIALLLCWIMFWFEFPWMLRLLLLMKQYTIIKYASVQPTNTITE